MSLGSRLECEQHETQLLRLRTGSRACQIQSGSCRKALLGLPGTAGEVRETVAARWLCGYLLCMHALGLWPRHTHQSPGRSPRLRQTVRLIWPEIHISGRAAAPGQSGEASTARGIEITQTTVSASKQFSMDHRPKARDPTPSTASDAGDTVIPNLGWSGYVPQTSPKTHCAWPVLASMQGSPLHKHGTGSVTRTQKATAELTSALWE